MPEASPGASLVIKEAVKRYGDVSALDGISMAIEAGEFVTLLGPSGSGKTTTLNAIAGFIQLTSGEILLDGAPIAPIPTHRRNIGVIFQNYALFPHLTAAANIAYPLKQRKVPRSERDDRVRDALGLVGLGDIGHRYPRELSGGQQQRVALARAIVFNPRVLLMDEPLGALDRKLREGLQREIKSIHRDLGITFVYVTHDQEEALALSDRIAVFRDGRIEQIGSPAALYEQPSNPFVAGFMGESNLVEGEPDGSPGAGSVRFRVASLPETLVVAASSVPERSRLLIRPEKISLSKAASPTSFDNLLTGVVRDISPLGPTRRVSVQCGKGVQFVVREDAHRGVPIEVGDEVVIGWNAGDAMLVPETKTVLLSDNPTHGGD